MNSKNANSARPMESMSTNEQTSSVLPEAALTEAAFLQRQADHARIAISKAFADASASLGQGIDPRQWTRRHPIVAISSAAVAGFTAAVVSVPPKEKKIDLTWLQKMGKALHPPQRPRPVESGANDNGTTKKSSPSLAGTILHEVIHLLQPLLTSVLVSTMGGRAPATVPAGHDGHDNPATP